MSKTYTFWRDLPNNEQGRDFAARRSAHLKVAEGAIRALLTLTASQAERLDRMARREARLRRPAVLEPTQVLHIGVPVTHLHMAAGILNDWTLEWSVEGDGWQAWGESLGDDGNDETTLHLFVEIPAGWATGTPRALLAALISDVGLVPLEGPAGAVVGVVSDLDDWSMGQEEITAHDLF